MTDMLNAALGYARMGWPVFPLHAPRGAASCSCSKAEACDRRGKHPRTPNGLQDASTDEATIRAWWARWPDANIGVRTGNGLVVVDVDSADPAEVESLMPPTRRVHTGRGRHYYFRGDAKSGQNVYGQGVDVRGAGGYVVAPPSLHASGARYEWDPSCELVADLPDLGPKKSGRRKAAPASPASPPPVPTDPGRQRVARARAWLAKRDPAVQGKDGSGHTLTTAIEVLAFVAGDRETALGLLRTWNVTCQPPWSEAELQHKVDDALRADIYPELAARREQELTAMDDAPRLVSAPSRATVGVTAPASDLANAGRLVDAFGAELRYVPDWGKWLSYDGGRWSLDGSRCLQLAADASRLQLEEALGGLRTAAGSEDESDRKQAKAAYDWACKSQSAPRLNAALTLAAVDPRVSVVASQLDAGAMLFNVENGTIDLASGRLRPHRREDLLTKIAPVRFDAGATCPTWNAFLLRAMGGNHDLVSFLQRWSGYTMTGDVREHALVFHHGAGGNGKSTFCGLRLRLLGDYAMPAPRGLLFRRAVDVHPTELASLFGARLALVPETEDGQAFDEPKLKDLTGGDRISARRMNEDFWSFAPTHKLEICGNHKPVVRGTDIGIWRRQRLVPWDVTIPPEEQDKDLSEKLWAERSGILNWMVAGCLEWQRIGLAPPAAVTEATEAYRDESDPLGEFFLLRCVFEPDARVARAHLRTAYEEHCTENGIKRPLDAKAFGRRLRELGCEDKNVKVRGASVNGWSGVRLRDLEREPVGSNSNGRAAARLAKTDSGGGTHWYPPDDSGGGEVGSKWVSLQGQSQISDPRVGHTPDLIPTRYPPTHHETSGPSLEDLYEEHERRALKGEVA